MGCWNVTCMLTNLPIFAGEKIVTYVIAQQEHVSGYIHYPRSLYAPISFQLFGEYDEGGWMEKIENAPMLDRTIDLTGEMLWFKGQENCGSDPEGAPPPVFRMTGDYISHVRLADAKYNFLGSREATCLADMMERMVARDHVRYRTQWGGTQKTYSLSLAYIKRSVYDAFVEPHRGAIDDVLFALSEEAPKLFAGDGDAAPLELMLKYGRLNFSETLCKRFEGPEPYYPWEDKRVCIAESLFRDSMGCDDFTGRRFIQTWQQECYKKQSFDSAEVKALAETVIIEMAVADLRRTWQPCTGSQEGLTDSHKIWDKAYQEAISKLQWSDEE